MYHWKTFKDTRTFLHRGVCEQVFKITLPSPLCVWFPPDTLDSFMWGSYSASLWNIGGSTQVPPCASDIHSQAPEVCLHQWKLNKLPHMKDFKVSGKIWTHSGEGQVIWSQYHNHSAMDDPSIIIINDACSTLFIRKIN